MNTKNRFAAIAMMIAMIVVGVGSHLWADQLTRFRARENKIINGFQAELRGDYREAHSPVRLNAELEKINLPVGTKIAFCLVHDNVKSLLGVASVTKQAGVSVAEVELEANDGDFVPRVEVGDVLQARQHAVAPFLQAPGCNSALLMSAPFER